MATRSMKIKVRVSDLITRIQKAKDEAVAEYEKASSTYVDRVAKAAAQVNEGLASIDFFPIDPIASLSHQYVGGRYAWVTEVKMPRNWQKPVKPSKPDLKDFDRDIALLRMAADETLSISLDDHYARYL